MAYKFNPFTGTLDIVTDSSEVSDNFSYDYLAQDLTIPLNQQMIVVDTFELGSSTLILLGKLCLI